MTDEQLQCLRNAQDALWLGDTALAAHYVSALVTEEQNRRFAEWLVANGHEVEA